MDSSKHFRGIERKESKIIGDQKVDQRIHMSQVEREVHMDQKDPKGKEVLIGPKQFLMTHPVIGVDMLMRQTLVLIMAIISILLMMQIFWVTKITTYGVQ